MNNRQETFKKKHDLLPYRSKFDGLFEYNEHKETESELYDIPLRRLKEDFILALGVFMSLTLALKVAEQIKSDDFQANCP